jgi:hypothetical protein
MLTAASHAQACHMHAGYVLDQEGDSWAVAFHDADDAAAFSLQVRHACRWSVTSINCKRQMQDHNSSAADFHLCLACCAADFTSL